MRHLVTIAPSLAYLGATLKKILLQNIHLSLGFCASPWTWSHDVEERGVSSTVIIWGASSPGVQGSGSDRTLHVEEGSASLSVLF